MFARVRETQKERKRKKMRRCFFLAKKVFLTEKNGNRLRKEEDTKGREGWHVYAGCCIFGYGDSLFALIRYNGVDGVVLGQLYDQLHRDAPRIRDKNSGRTFELCYTANGACRRKCLDEALVRTVPFRTCRDVFAGGECLRLCCHHEAGEPHTAIIRLFLKNVLIILFYLKVMNNGLYYGWEVIRQKSLAP